jgi:hypothetical protein
MDDAMMSRLLQSYGASNSAGNANRVREFYASNPQAAEHRAMGMRGSLQEDNTDLLGPMLEKLMAQTDGTPPGRVEVGAPEVQPMPTVQAASAPTRRAATAAPQYGPNTPMATGAVNPLDGPATALAAPQRQGSFWDDILISLLGATSAGGAAAMRNRGGAGGAAPSGGGGGAAPQGTPEATFVGRMGEAARNDPRASGYLPRQQGALPAPDGQVDAPNAKLPAPDKRISSSRPDYNYEGTGKEIEGVNARNQSEKTARKDVIQKEVDAENESAGRLQEQMRKRAADEAATADLIKKAKRAVGRK